MFKRMPVVLVTLILVLGIAVRSFPQSPSKTFVYKPLVGQALKYKVNSNTDQSIKFESYPSQPVQIMLDIEFSVGSDSARSDGSIPFLMTFDKVDATSRNASGTTAYANTAVLNGQTFTAIINPLGKVLETPGIELLPRVQVVMENPLGQNFGDVLKQLFVEIPDRAISPGETWEQTTTDSTNESGIVTKTTVKGTYQLKKVGAKDGATLAEVSGKLDIDVVQGGVVMGGETAFHGGGKGKVEWVFDIDRGVLVSQKASSLVDGILKIKGAQNYTATVTTNTEGAFKLVK